MKKIITVFLALLMVVFIFPVETFAKSFDQEKTHQVLTDSEIITVTDDNGNSIDVIFEEYTDYRLSQEDVIRPQGMYPDYPVGTTKTWTFRISNTSLGVPSLVVGAPVGKTIKDALQKAITKKLGEKIGSSLIPGLNIASWVASAIAAGNAIVGNNGFQATVKGTYSKTYFHRDGYYVYGWSLDSFNLGTY